MNIPRLKKMVLTLVLAISLPVIAFSQPKLDVEVVEAIQQSNVSYVDHWLSNGGEIDRLSNTDNTLLILASKVGDRQMMEYLLGQHADVNIQNKAGSTALMLAAKYGHSTVVDMLLKHGADPTTRNNHGITAARFALAYDHDDVYRQLQRAELVSRKNS